MTTSNSNTPTPALRFDAFISYRRKDGGWHAKNLRRRLLEAPIPKEVIGDKPRRLSIYLDTIYERATEDFFEHTIKPALSASRHLIVIQSASASKPLPGNRPNWLVREIEYFLSLPPEGRSISVVTTSRDFDATLPADLHRRFPNIERLDLSRWHWYRPGAADEAVLTLSAALHEIPDEQMPLLRQEEARRQARRWRKRAIAASALTTILAGLLALVAVLYSTSEERRRLATSRLLAVESATRVDRRIDEALGLAVHAYATEPTIEAQSALLDALRRSPLLDRVLYGARGQIQRVVTSRDRRYVAAADNSGALSVWNISTGALVGQQVVGANVLFEAVDFDHDSERLFTAIPDGQLDVWAMSSGTLQRRDSIPRAGIIQVLRVSPDGSVLVTGDLTGEIRVREVARLRESRSLGRHSSGVTSIAIDHGLVVTGALNGTVIVQRLDGSERRTIEAHGGGTFGVALEDSGSSLITAGLDGRVLRWTLADLKTEPHEVAKVPGRILSLAASATASVIGAGLADGTVALLSEAHGSDLQQLGGHADRVRGLAITTDGSRLFAGASDGRVLVWRPLGPENLMTRLFAHRSTPQAVQFDARGESVASADLGGTVVVWARDGALSRHDVSDRVETVSTLSFTPNGRFVAVAGDGKTLIWSRDQPPTTGISVPETIGPVERLHFSSSDRLSAIDSHGGVTVLSWPGLHTERGLHPQLKGSLLSSAMSRSGSRLALGSNTGELLVVELPTLNIIAGPWQAHRDSVSDVTFNDDASSVVSVGDDGYLAEWRLDSSGEHFVRRLGNGQGRFFSVSYWPGRNVVAAGHENGTIQMFDLREGRALGRAIAAHTSYVQALGFAADGRRLASSGAEGVISMWETGHDVWVTTACAIAQDAGQSVINALGLGGGNSRPCARPAVAASRWQEPRIPAGWPERPSPSSGSSVVGFRPTITTRGMKQARARTAPQVPTSSDARQSLLFL